jgi:hypothetical protein
MARYSSFIKNRNLILHFLNQEVNLIMNGRMFFMGYCLQIDWVNKNPAIFKPLCSRVAGFPYFNLLFGLMLVCVSGLPSRGSAPLDTLLFYARVYGRFVSSVTLKAITFS